MLERGRCVPIGLLSVRQDTADISERARSLCRDAKLSCKRLKYTVSVSYRTGKIMECSRCLLSNRANMAKRVRSSIWTVQFTWNALKHIVSLTECTDTVLGCTSCVLNYLVRIQKGGVYFLEHMQSVLWCVQFICKALKHRVRVSDLIRTVSKCSLCT